MCHEQDPGGFHRDQPLRSAASVRRGGGDDKNVTAITLGAGVLIIAVVGMAPLLLAAGGFEGRAPRH